MVVSYIEDEERKLVYDVGKLRLYYIDDYFT